MVGRELLLLCPLGEDHPGLLLVGISKVLEGGKFGSPGKNMDHQDTMRGC